MQPITSPTTSAYLPAFYFSHLFDIPLSVSSTFLHQSLGLFVSFQHNHSVLISHQPPTTSTNYISDFHLFYIILPHTPV